MLKGVPQSKRDSRWHKRHERRLFKDKQRRKARKGKARAVGVSRERAEAQFKAAQKRERQKKAPPLMARWSRRLWLWIISLRIIVWIRKLWLWYNERKYKG